MDKTLVDEECLSEMRSLMQGDYSPLLANFLRDTENYLEEVASALRAGDVTRAALTAHKIKSSAGQFGFRKMQHLAAGLEYPIGASVSQLMHWQEELQAAYRETLAYLTQHALR